MTRQLLQIDLAKQMTSTREVDEWLLSPQAHQTGAMMQFISVDISNRFDALCIFQEPSNVMSLEPRPSRSVSSNADSVLDSLQDVRNSIERMADIFTSAIKPATSAVTSPQNQELLQSWSETDESEVQEQRDTWNYLREALDKDEDSVRLSSGNLITSLDLSPFELQEVDLENSRLRFRQPLVLVPLLDESGQMLVIENADWELCVFAPTREQLWEELREQIAMLWREYAQEEDDVLSPPALDFKQHLLRHIEEISFEEGALVP